MKSIKYKVSSIWYETKKIFVHLFPIQDTKYKILNTSPGFAMLFAVLTSSLVLSIGLSIFNLTLKELALSSIGRESQFAFYAADSGVECVLYWDSKDSRNFATSSQSQGGWRDSVVDAQTPTCAGKSIAYNMKNASSTDVGVPTPPPGNAVSRFTLEINPEGYCVSVTITKTVNGSGFISTSIDSRGYNTCVATDPSRVERALRISY